MRNAPPYTITNNSVTVVWEGRPHTVQEGAPNYGALRAALLEGRWDDIEQHLTVKQSLKKWAKGLFTVEENTFSYNGEALPHELNSRVLAMATAGNDPSYLLNFWERLQKNPSHRSVTQLFSFLLHEGISFTEDGCFLAYKSVRDNYLDHHSGTFVNKPGAVLKMPRNKISDDPRHACHEGLHVGALSYAQTFGGSGSRIVICKIAPENVVCVPYDESQRKMRVCEYEVIGNYGCLLPSTVYKLEQLRVEEASERTTTETAPAKHLMDEDDPPDDPPDDEDDEDLEPEDEPHDGDVFPDDIEKTEARQGLVDILATKAAEEAPKPEVEEKAATKEVGGVQVPKEYQHYLGKSTEELLECSLDELRKYATYGLKIVGASKKFPGGKVALIAAIMDVVRPK